jgi:hypothetical protein
MGRFSQKALEAAVAAKRKSGRTNQFTANTVTVESEQRRNASKSAAMKGRKLTDAVAAKIRSKNVERVRRELEEQPEDLPYATFVTDGSEEEYVDF